MSHSVSDIFATLFTAQFYQRIAEELSVPLAFSKALKISREGNGKSGLPFEFWISQSLIPQLYLTQNLQLLTRPATANTRLERRGAGNFWQTGRLREKLQKIHRFVGREGKDFIFIGRRREQKAIRRYLNEAAPIFLHGQGGLGKTALAVHTAERLVLADPDDTQVFMFDENTFRIGQVTDELLGFLKNEQKQILLAHQIKSMDQAWDKFLHALQEVLHRSKPVFIFDNLESFQPAGGGDFLPEYSLEWDIITNLADMGLPLLLTGRYPLPTLPNLHTVPLHEPTRPDFAVKCRYLTIAEKIPQGEAGQPVFETLFRSFGGNYRALEFFDTFYREKKEAFGEVLDSLGDFIQKHAAQPELLAKMSENLVFERLLGLLAAPERKVLLLLSQFRRPVLPLAVEIQDAALLQVGTALKRLSGLTLAEESREEAGLAFFYVPMLTRLLLNRSGVLTNKIDEQRAGEYYDYAAENVTHLVEDDGEAFFHLIRTENVEKINKIGERLTGFLYNNSRFQNALLTAKLIFSNCGDKTASNVFNWLGLIFDLFGQYEEASFFYEKKLKKDYENGDRISEGATLNNVAGIAQAKGDYNTALRYLEQSLKTQRAIGDQTHEGTTLNNISQIYMAKGDYEVASWYLEQSLKIQQKIGNLSGEATTLNNIAGVAHAKGEYKTSLLYLEQSLKIIQNIGHQKEEGGILNNISQIYSTLGDYDTSLRYLEQSLKIRQKIGDKVGECITLVNIGHIYYVKGDYNTPLEYLEQSLKISKTNGNLENEGIALDNIGQIWKAKGNLNTALQYLEQSLKIRQEIGDKFGEGTTLNNIGYIYATKGNYDTAIGFYEQSLKVRQAIGDIAGLATTLINMGEMLLEQNQWEQAVPVLMQAHLIFQKIGLPDIKDTHRYLGAIIEQIGETRFQEILAASNQSP